MKRDPAALSVSNFDVVIVGGGVFGACAAWDAASRGLSVALIERGDFGQATSANSFKMVHGGIRYLQHGDIVRLRQSSRERNALLRLAPHLVHPLPILIPTYGRGMKGRTAMAAAMKIYDWAAFDRNRGINDPERMIPGGRSISRGEVLDMFPGLEPTGLTGAAVFSDAQMYNPPRLVLAFVQSAVAAGTVAVNYVEATGFLKNGDRVSGIAARDTLTGESFDIRATETLNAAGPYAEHLLSSGLGIRLSPPGTYSRDACFVVARPLTGDHALAVQGSTSDPDAVISRGARHLFIVPWRGHTLIGVWHVVYQGRPDGFMVTPEDLQRFIDEINFAYPPLNLNLDDVSMINAGLVPFGENAPGAKNLSYGKRSRLIDHAKEHATKGLTTLIGVRYTTAHEEARRAIDLILKKLGKRADHATAKNESIHGGCIDAISDFLASAQRSRPETISADSLHALVRNYGSAYRAVTALAEKDPRLWETVGESTVIKAEIVHAVREEMAKKLADVVMRRTDLGTGANPGHSALSACADLMADELNWTAAQRQSEIDETAAVFPLVRKEPAQRLASP